MDPYRLKLDVIDTTFGGKATVRKKGKGNKHEQFTYNYVSLKDV